MKIAIRGSDFFIVTWLVPWLLIANVPTETVPPSAFPDIIRELGWVMVWVPLAFIGHLRLSKQGLLLSMLVVAYIFALNIAWFNRFAILMFASIFSGLMIVSSYSGAKYEAHLVRALDIVLLSWSGMLVVQFIIYSTSGVIPDFHHALFPWSHPRDSRLAVSLFRLTGPHIEPGTYANWTYGLVLLRMILRNRLVSIPTSIAIATVPLTLSAWGMLAVACYCASLIVFSKSWRRFGWSLLSLVLIVVLSWSLLGRQFDNIVAYFNTRAQLGDESGEAKLHAYAAFATHLHNYIILGNSFRYIYCPDCLSPQDAGIFINGVVYLGLVVTAVLFAALFIRVYRELGVAGLIFLLPLPFAKLFVWDPIFWLLVAYSTDRLLLSKRGKVRGTRFLNRESLLPGVGR